MFHWSVYFCCWGCKKYTLLMIQYKRVLLYCTSVIFSIFFITLLPFFSGSGHSSRPFSAVHTDTVLSPFIRPIHGANLLKYNEIYSYYIQQNIYSLDLCTICHEPLDDGHTCSQLECGHAFHKHCAKFWFKKQSTCPLCK